MAYRITYGNSVVYEPSNESRAVHGAKMALSAEGISTLDFTVPPTHPLAQSFVVNDLTHLVDVTFDGKLLFRGIVTRLSTGMTKEVTVHCESELVRLKWVMARSDSGAGNLVTAPALLNWCLSRLIESPSGSDLSNWAARCTIDPDDADVGYPSTRLGHNAVGELPASPTDLLSLLVENTVSKYGCILYIDYDRTAGWRTVTLSKPTASTAAQTMRLGENLTNYLQQATAEDTYTACYPVGSDQVVEYDRIFSGQMHVTIDAFHGATSLWIEMNNPNTDQTLYSGDYLAFGSSSGNGVWYVKVSAEAHIEYAFPTEVKIDREIPENVYDPTDVRYVRKDSVALLKTLTLSELTDRTVTVDGRTFKKVGPIVYDTAAESAFGVKMMSVSDSDTLLAGDLLSQAIHELRQRNQPQTTIEIQGVDMAMYTTNHTHLRAGDSVRVISEPHGLDEVMLVRKIDLNLDNPAQNKYSIGKAMTTATGQIRGAYGEAASVRERVMRKYR